MSPIASASADPAVSQPTHTIIDLRSDTVSQPTKRMRQAMADAEVGDDVCGEDPTINALEQKCAELFGKEAAIFVTSGTMGNLISIMVHCNRRGAEVIAGDQSHIFRYEQGGAASIAGVLLSTIPNNDDGTFCLKELKCKLRGYDQHEPITTMVCVENTHNMCGGKVLPLDWLDEFCMFCRDNSLIPHMDGARLFEASEYLNVPVARIARDFDSVTFCLSKSLCAPVGSVIVGSAEFIRQARRMRKVLGGAMRQAGILAAAAIVALEDIVPHVSESHVRLRRIAQAINDVQCPYITIDPAAVQTNICIIKISGSDKYSGEYISKRLQEVTENEIKDGVTDKNGHGIILKVSSRDWNFFRLVTYFHITDEMVDLAIKKFEYCLKELK